MNDAPQSERQNRLGEATSPYLRQHAQNPVDWYEWGPAALTRAAAEDRPILLSIGYSACHWCHVMAHESFEDPETAALMNAEFVNVKVDREERPDLDDIYMAATVAMNQGRGGWPMTVFLTPDQRPFFAGTYFPPEDRHGLPAFRTVLQSIARVWRDDRARAREVGERLTAMLGQSARTDPGGLPGDPVLRDAIDHFWSTFDSRYGGFGSAPKFPPATAITLLLRAGERFDDERARRMARETLEAMARGGIYDHVAGGFSRYATDARWLVPHFEKMLYDNALLARAYLEGATATGDPFFERIGREVLDYALREMQAPDGGFYSATDADSEGEEGKFFVWTPSQLRAVLGEEDAGLFGAYYDIRESGNWEGKSIPNTPRPLTAVAKLEGLTPAELSSRLESARRKVYAARRKRIPPALDDKVIVAWNGLMISALVEGHWVLGDPRYLRAATRSADFLRNELRDSEGRLLRSWRAGVARQAGVLEDHAAFANALIDLYEAGAGDQYLREAEQLLDELRRRFAAEGGGFFSTASDHEPLIVRHREGHDGATPSANAIAARALARLSFHLGSDDLREAATAAIAAYGAAIEAQPRAFAASLLVADLLREGPVELAFIGPPDDPALEALRREVARRYLPRRIIAHHDPARGEATLPLAAGKSLVGGSAALYVCKNFSCRAPVTKPEQVTEVLGPARERDSV